MAIQYTRKKETTDSSTTYHVTDDMVFPGMQVARPFEQEQRTTIVKDELLEGKAEEPIPTEDISAKKRKFSWWSFLGGMALAAALLAILIWIGVSE